MWRFKTFRISGYMPQDETYRQLKRRILGREDYRFKLLVRLYELPGQMTAQAAP